MHIPADESCDFRVVLALREAGHDVRAVVEESPGAPDERAIGQAEAEERLLVTEDRDFGQLVPAQRLSLGAGVFHLRCPESDRERLPGAVVATIREYGPRLAGSFATWTPRRLRIRRAQGS